MIKSLCPLIFILLLFRLASIPAINAQAVGHTKDGPVENLSKKRDPNLTDQERYESENFLHEGLINRTYQEGCDKIDGGSACKGKGKTKYMGMDSSMVQAIAKAYTMVIGAMGMGDNNGFKLKEKNFQEAQAKDPDAKKTKKDYCQYIAMGTEAVGTFMQTTAQNNIQSPEGNSDINQNSATPVQRQLLYKAARGHRERAKTAKFQATGWGATTACYGYMATQGIVLKDWQIWAKLGASTLLTGFYANEVKQNEGFADELNSLAEKLPGAGECNPHTDKDCYCAQPETQYDPNHCLVGYHKKKLSPEIGRVSCIDNKARPDPKCECVKNDTCMNKKVYNDFAGTDYGQAFLQSPQAKDFASMAKGELTSADLSGVGIGKNARSMAQLKKLEDKLPMPKRKLLPSEQKQMKALLGLGVPSKLGALIAMRPRNLQAEKEMKNLATSDRGLLKKNYIDRHKVLHFNGGRGLKGKKKSTGDSTYGLFKKLKRERSKGRQTSSDKVLHFAKKATAQGQISPHNDKIIFDIISRRYQVSGVRRLQGE